MDMKDILPVRTRSTLYSPRDDGGVSSGRAVNKFRWRIKARAQRGAVPSKLAVNVRQFTRSINEETGRGHSLVLGRAA